MSGHNASSGRNLDPEAASFYTGRDEKQLLQCSLLVFNFAAVLRVRQMWHGYGYTRTINIMSVCVGREGYMHRSNQSHDFVNGII